MLPSILSPELKIKIGKILIFFSFFLHLSVENILPRHINDFNFQTILGSDTLDRFGGFLLILRKYVIVFWFCFHRGRQAWPRYVLVFHLDSFRHSLDAFHVKSVLDLTMNTVLDEALHTTEFALV